MPSTKTPRSASKTRYEYKPPKAGMRATKENPLIGGIASGLGTFRDFLDQLSNAKLPRPAGVLGAGHAFIGEAPEEIHEWAKGFSPFSEEPNLGNRLDPRIKPGREQGVLDVAMTGADLATLGLAGLRRGVRAAYPTLNPEMNMGRREFMDKAGKVAAGAAAAAAVPAALRGIEHTAPRAAEHVAPTVVKAASKAVHVAPQEFRNIFDLARLKYVKETGIDPDYWTPPAAVSPERREAYKAEYYRERSEWEKGFDEKYGNKLRKKYGVEDDARYQLGEDVGAKIKEIARKKFPHDEAARQAEFGRLVEEWREAHVPKLFDQLTPYLERGETYIDPTNARLVGVDPEGYSLYEHPAFPNWRGNYGELHEKMHEGGKFLNDYTGLQEYGPAYQEWLEKNYGKFLDEGKAAGGSVTMPDNYRKGGRVRMI